MREDSLLEIGKRIKELRQKNMLTQEELGNRCGLTKGFISQVERDLNSPSISTFIDILEGLGTNPVDFFRGFGNDKVVFKDEDIFDLEENGYRISWLVSNAQKNQMEPILLCLQAGEKYKEIEPFDGEEFGYVLSGKVTLRLGNNEYIVKKGESFYFQANYKHTLINHGKTEAKLLWVTTPPNF